MKRLLLIISALLATTHANAEEIEFYVGQASAGWAFNITGKGRALVGDSLIFARLDNIKITNNPKYATPKHIKDVEVAYGYSQPDGKWSVKRVGARKSIDRATYAGDTVELHSLDAALSLSSEERPNDYWVVVIVWISETQSVYAHSRKDIF